MRIAVFSADPVIGEALSCLLTNMGGMEVVACMSGIGSARGMIDSQKPDVLLVTEDFSDEASRSALKKLRQGSGVKVMLLHAGDSLQADMWSEFDRVQSRWPGVGSLFDALKKLGGDSHGPLRMSEPARPTAESLRTILPIKNLTVRESETAELVAVGMSNMQIASALGISEPTVKLYVSKLLRLFDCDNRVQLALKLTSARPESVARV